MKTKFNSKLLGVLLVLVMVLALVPVSALTAFAAGGTEFVHFAIEEHWGVYFEQTGSNNLYPITLTNENKLSVPLPALYRTDYDGYVFDGWYIADTDTKVTQDTVFDGYTVVVDRWTFREKDYNTVISSIKVNNVALEAGMTTAEYNAAVQGATATVNGAPADAITADSAKTYTIYHGLNKSGEPLGADEEVLVGQDYSVVTKIKLANGYTFSPNITFISDGGMCASERFLGGADIYTKQWNTLATEIEMTINFMNTDYYFEQTPESRKLENYAQYKNWYTISKLEGLESVTLQYESDGAWALFIDNVPFEANGEQAGGFVTVSPYVNTTKTFRLVANYALGTVYSEPFEVSWARLNPVIDNVGIAVTVPMSGYAPEYTVTTDGVRYLLKNENSTTVKNGIKWTGETGELRVSDGMFADDSDYTVGVTLVAQDGYTFANSVTATVNGGKANVSVKSETEIIVSYTFPKYEPPVTKYYVVFSNAGGYASGTMPTEWVEAGNYTLPAPGYTPYKGYEFVGWMIQGELKQPGDVISISDNVVIDARWKNADAEKIGSLGISITAPKNENSPEYTAILTTSKCKLKDVSGISWVGENVGELNVNSKFNNDNDYTVTIKLVAEDGYKFTNSVTATVNANNAIVLVKSESEIWVSYTFAKPVKHIVTFNTNSTFATGTMSPVEAVEGSYTLPAHTYTPKYGYTFAGWLLNGYLRQPGDEITLTSPTTLEARWKSDYAPVGFIKQPSEPDAKTTSTQIQYRVSNFEIDPSIAYDSILAQVYNEDTGEWVSDIYDGGNLVVTAGNGAVDSGYGYDIIVFYANIAKKYTFRIIAKNGGDIVASSESFTVRWIPKSITVQPKGDMIDIGETYTVTIKTNFYISSSEIEYYDAETDQWKLYTTVGSSKWQPFTKDLTSNTESSLRLRVKIYESPGNLTDTSNEFTITWTNHKHTYGVSPNGKDEANHWKECTDPACPDQQNSIIEVTPHKAIGGNCQTEAACACGEMLLGSHMMSYEWTHENGQHFHKCAVQGCTHTDEKVNCSGGMATCTEKATCATCGEKYGELAEHAYIIENGYKGADGHANVCECGAQDTPVAHTPDRAEATEDEPVKCSDCGYIITPALGHTTHTPKDEWKSDEQNHWHECVGCEGQELEKGAHADSDDDGKCDVCDAAFSTGEGTETNETEPDDTEPDEAESNETEPDQEQTTQPESEQATADDPEQVTDPEHEPSTDPEQSTKPYPEKTTGSDADTIPPEPEETSGTTIPSDGNGDADGLGVGAIVGIVIASLLILGAGGFAVFWFVIKKKSFSDLAAICKKKE